MNKKYWRRLGAPVLAVVTAAAAPAYALDPFYVAVDLNSDGSIDFSQGFSNITDAIDQLDYTSLQRAGYDGTQAFDVAFALRGLGASIDFPNSGAVLPVGSGDLVFTINGVAFNNGTNTITFHAANANASTASQRSDTLDQLKDYLKKNKDALKSILTAFAQHSPIDPLAGNPDSLFGQRMKNDFSYGFTNKVSQIWGCNTSAFNFTNDQPIQVASAGGTSDIFADAQARAADLQAQNELGFGVLASSTKAKAVGGDYATTALTIPLSYTAKLDSDPRKKIRFDLPLTYIDSAGAISYSLGVGLAYTHPLSDNWSLTPAVGVGATGSQDLGSAGGVGSYSLTSAYTWRFDSVALSMGNSVGRYQSIGIKIGDVEAAADVNNTVYTNGFLLTGPNSLIAKNLVMEYSFIDTRITGDTVYSDSSDEIGVAIGHISTDMGVIDSYTKLGLSYLMAQGEAGDISSIRLLLTSRF